MLRRLLLLSLCAATAFAQEATATMPVERPEAEPPPMATPSAPPLTARQQRDGTVGVGLLGMSSMTPAGGLSGLGGLAGFGLGRVLVPVLGVRWWLKGSQLGLEFGLGAMVSVLRGGFDGSPNVQFLAHVGVPISVVSTQHVIVFLGPELRAGFTTQSSTSGFANEGSLLELGAHAGVELFFGFIGVPALSLEAGLRLGLAREAQQFTSQQPLGSPLNSGNFENWRVTTSLSGDAGSLVASTLALKYYF